MSTNMNEKAEMYYLVDDECAVHLTERNGFYEYRYVLAGSDEQGGGAIPFADIKPISFIVGCVAAVGRMNGAAGINIRQASKDDYDWITEKNKLYNTVDKWMPELAKKTWPDCLYERFGDTFIFENYRNQYDDIPDSILHQKETQDEPREVLEDYLTGRDSDVRSYYASEDFSDLRKAASKDQEHFMDEEGDLIDDWIRDHIYHQSVFDDFAGQEVCVNLVIAMPYERDMGIEGYYTDAISALFWIAEQYGKEGDLISALDCYYLEFKDPFIESVITELKNYNNYITYGMGVFTVLLKMPYSDFIRLVEMKKAKNGSVTIKPNVTCGIFNPWMGVGSCMEVELTRPVKIPADLIWDAWIDGSKMHGYDPGDVYGFGGSAWTDKYELNDSTK